MLSFTARRSVVRASFIRNFSSARIAMTEGAINETGDKFAEKERAQENLYIKKHEAEQLKKLRERLQQQKETLDQLEKDITESQNKNQS
ncbi:hypothetical protein JA1_001840 [Spathaspora sp. JA1]|nr:hypothetical protein JA1_001840 [Spathaspora sp. JA1]